MISPADCVVGLGIPTTRTAFLADLQRGDKDFAKRFHVWARYYIEFVRALEEVEPVVTRLRVRIVHDLTLVDFGSIVANTPVFILFSHWVGDQVEFADGLRPASRIVNALPSNYNGILDLCVCRSDALASAVRAKCPNCLIRHVADRELTPAYWLYFHLVLFKRLDGEKMTYIDAVEDVVRTLVSRLRKPSK